MKALKMFGHALLAIVLCCGISSCSKKDDNAAVTVTSNEISKAVGTWTLVDLGQGYYANRLTINSNGTFRLFSTTNASYAETGKYTIKGNTLSVKFDDEDEWEVCTIETLTETSFVYYRDNHGDKIYTKWTK